MTLCPDCGEELDEITGLCSCAFDRPARPKPPPGRVAWNMRSMVARKLGRQPRTDGRPPTHPLDGAPRVSDRPPDGAGSDSDPKKST